MVVCAKTLLYCCCLLSFNCSATRPFPLLLPAHRPLPPFCYPLCAHAAPCPQASHILDPPPLPPCWSDSDLRVLQIQNLSQYMCTLYKRSSALLLRSPSTATGRSGGGVRGRPIRFPSPSHTHTHHAFEAPSDGDQYIYYVSKTCNETHTQRSFVPSNLQHTNCRLSLVNAKMHCPRFVCSF